MFIEMINAAVTVQEKDAPTVLVLLWGAVIGGGILGLVMMSVAKSSYNPSAAKVARYAFLIAMFAVIPALSLSCSMSSN